jgi:truncated hemoglobin YjbI
VPADAELARLFAGMPPDQPERAGAWLAEVFAGPKLDSSRYGDGRVPTRLISQGADADLTEDARARWVSLMLQCAQEAGLPKDAEFRSAFASFLEWDSRMPEKASTDAAERSESRPPQWHWGVAGRPVRQESTDATEDGEVATTPPGPDDSVSFSRHVKPLFRARDRQSMSFAFDLWSYADVKANAKAILERLQSGSMPCDDPWDQPKLQTFERWVATGAAE